MRQDAPILEQARRRLANLVTATVEQTAQVLEEEQKEVKRCFPALANKSARVLHDPSAIRNLPGSKEYRRVVDAYVAGRLKANLLAKVLDMLRQIAPMEFSSGSESE